MLQRRGDNEIADSHAISLDGNEHDKKIFEDLRSSQRKDNNAHVGFRMAEKSSHAWWQPKAFFRGAAQGWRSPGDVAALLMILNGDIVQKALAQMSGPRLVPVAFSFGWVVYSIQALSTAIGTGRLMPAVPDWDSIVVNVRSGHARVNRSWILGRLLRDWKYDPKLGENLCITVLDAVNQADLDQDAEQVNIELTDLRSIEPRQRDGSTEADQDPERGPSAGPVTHNASTMVVTADGTLFALAFGSLQRWKDEKWPDRKSSNDGFCLLQGNGCRHVMVVYANGIGLNFEHLAGGWIPMQSGIILKTGIHALLWVVLLIVIAREEGQTWPLLIIGGLGMIQNIVIAGAPRSASALGFHLKKSHVFRGEKVLKVLCDAERKLEDVGFTLRPILFPGKEQQSDIEALTKAKNEREAEAAGAKNAQNEQRIAHPTEAAQGEISARMDMNTEGGRLPDSQRKPSGAATI